MTTYGYLTFSLQIGIILIISLKSYVMKKLYVLPLAILVLATFLFIGMSIKDNIANDYQQKIDALKAERTKQNEPQKKDAVATPYISPTMAVSNPEGRWATLCLSNDDFGTIKFADQGNCGDYKSIQIWVKN